MPRVCNVVVAGRASACHVVSLLCCVGFPDAVSHARAHLHPGQVQAGGDPTESAASALEYVGSLPDEMDVVAASEPSQPALDSKGNEQKTFELKAPRERALALHASQQRSPNGPTGAIVAASPARAAGEDENFAPGERHGSYAYGSLYFEETRLRSRYMLCRGEPGACPPEEVMTNLCDEFGLPNPQMIFFGLGANL